MFCFHAIEVLLLPRKLEIENAAWKMKFPFTKVPFLGTFVHFQGCNMKNLPFFIGSLDSEIRILLDCSKRGKSTRHLPIVALYWLVTGDPYNGIIVIPI